MEEDYQMIIDYLRDELDQDARHQFETRLEKEPELRKELALHRKNFIATQLYGEGGLKAQLQGIAQTQDLRQEWQVSQEQSRPKDNRVRQLFLYIGAAAAVISLLIWFLGRMGNPDYARDYYATIAEDLLSEELKAEAQGAASVAPSTQILIDAMEAYGQKDYILAGAKLEIYLEEEAEDGEAKWYLAHCYIAMDQQEKATKMLGEALESSIVGDQAQLKLGAWHMAEGNYNKAKKLLEPLIDHPNAAIQQTARSILDL